MSYKFILFSDDNVLSETWRSAFRMGDLSVLPVHCFPGADERAGLLVLDGDSLSSRRLKDKIRQAARKKIPLALIFQSLDGRDVVELLKHGAVSILFKNYPVSRIKKEIRDVLYHHRYLESIREMAGNEQRIRFFLQVIKEISSSKDINEIMVSILNGMNELFGFEGISFFLAARDKLKRKMTVGEAQGTFPSEEHNLADIGLRWLENIHDSGNCIVITSKSRWEQRKFFKINTLLLPIVIKERFFGLIAASRKERDGRLSPSDKILLEAFAEQTAVVLENARLYWDIIQAREELVKQEKKSLLGQIILSLNHEINNPLSIISMEAQLLQRRLANKEDKIEARLSNIENNIDRIKIILETISSLDLENQISTEYVSGRQMLNLHNAD